MSVKIQLGDRNKNQQGFCVKGIARQSELIETTTALATACGFSGAAAFLAKCLRAFDKCNSAIAHSHCAQARRHLRVSALYRDVTVAM
jgi:hypothetical protein